MTASLLPQSFWFRLAVSCPRIDGLPKVGGKQRLDLPATCRIPQTSHLDCKEPWAEVRIAWNLKGLALVIEATSSLTGLASDELPDGLHGAQLWVDTRDTRGISRATRFCHRFDARLRPGTGKTSLGVQVQPRPIARAVADPPLARPSSIDSSAERTKNGWRIELFLSAEALNGFDPDTNRRLGFCYRVFDPERPEELLGIGREFPVGENPSLWSTLDLVDPA